LAPSAAATNPPRRNMNERRNPAGAVTRKPRDVFMKMATIVNTEYPADGASHRTNGPTNYCADRPRFSFALRSAFLRAAHVPCA
jgi:hypothetical protein